MPRSKRRKRKSTKMKTRKNRWRKKWSRYQSNILFKLVLPVVFIFLLTLLLIQALPEHEPFDQPDDVTYADHEVPAPFMPIYEAAEEEFGVPWYLLAAIHRVETIFSSMDSMVSPVGAEGHMQFMNCTWIGWNYPSCHDLGDLPDHVDVTDVDKIDTYGGYGVDASGTGVADPWDIEDAIFSAAHFLAANGAADGDFERAIFRYNHSMDYVDDVLYHASLYAENVEIVHPSSLRQ